MTFVCLANLPDWPIPNWGHDRYDVSHSIFVNVGLIAVIILLGAVCHFSQFARNRIPVRCLLLGAAAWMSHLLLDSFYNHGRGIAIFWPISDARLNLAIPWFRTLDLSQSVLNARNLAVLGIEAVAYGPVLGATLLIKRMSESFDLRQTRRSNSD